MINKQTPSNQMSVKLDTRTHHIKILIQYRVAGEILVPMLLQSPDKEPHVMWWGLFKVFSHSQANG